MRGEVGVEQALDRLHAGGIVPLIIALDADPSEPHLPFGLAVGRWRKLGVTGWRYVPAAPGDAAGVPGPASVRGAAIDAGAALVANGGVALALLPRTGDHGQPTRVLELSELETIGSLSRSVDSVAELDRQLLTALNDAADLLSALEVEQWNDDLPDLLTRWGDGLVLPPGAPARAQPLAVRSQRVLELLELAATGNGTSRTASEMSSRAATLGELARVARAAHAAAWNAGGSEASGRR